MAAVGYDSLYPPQQMALQAGIMEGKNILVTTPTASGKTLIAVMAALAAIERGQKVVYMTPLRALASEKYDDLQILERLSSERKVRVMLST
ncbi:MAG TPA: DEAD/DEAH box helicase, partial [Nitrososphaera sp.]|nr:DEAD/DEAH box helicase [Nitrososphaera sp.]